MQSVPGGKFFPAPRPRRNTSSALRERQAVTYVTASCDYSYFNFKHAAWQA